MSIALSSGAITFTLGSMTDGVSDTVIAAFTADEVRRLTGISLSQLRYWDRTEFFTPSLGTGSSGDGLPGRLYSFKDVVCLKILHAIRNVSKVSLPHLREVKVRLAHLGDGLWAKTVLYVLNKRVIFDNPETNAREEVTTGQKVLQIPLEIVRAEMSEQVRFMRQRDGSRRGHIETKRGVAQNQPVVAGTRIQVASIRAFHDAGYDAKRIIEEYPSLTEEDIRAALAYGRAA